MLVSHKHKFVFIHNPKVGGTTLNDALTKYCEQNAYRGRGLVGNEVVDLCHYRVDQWPEEIVKAYLDGYYFFGVVRNPYEKTLSAMSEHIHQHKSMIPFLPDTGELDTDNYYDQALSYNSIRHDWRYVHFCPQHEYFSIQGEYIKCDVFKLEDIAEWWSPLFEHLGVPAPELFNGRPSHFRPFGISDRMITLTNRLYLEDFIKFGYEPRMVPNGYRLSDESKVEELCLGADLEPTSNFQRHAARYRDEYGQPPQPLAITLLKNTLFP